ncbi:hypothetical protein TGFOU_404250 [Toxoplasma gondii FOU]|uniref:Uncharacterized protein n=1 Tax=Toxoplasma gondii FOU TaxID=943167 RepID=A0A086L701_TOXGO|nr:hypothetical protein TGFOU_404250 [Toxoplasma gondii FOU]
MSTPEEHRSPLVFSAPQSVSPYLSAAASSPFSAVHYAAPRSASVGGGPRLHAQKASDDSMRSHRAASAMPALQAAPGSAASHPKWVISRASVSPTPPLVRTSIDAVSDRAGSEDVARNRSDESLRGGIDGSETSGKKESKSANLRVQGKHELPEGERTGSVVGDRAHAWKGKVQGSVVLRKDRDRKHNGEQRGERGCEGGAANCLAPILSFQRHKEAEGHWDLRIF